MNVQGKAYRSVWMEGDAVRLVNQHLLPQRFEIVSLKTCQETAAAIRDMVVRGAPAIGAAAGYGLVQAALEAPDERFEEYALRGYETLKNTRPTARDLFYALDRVLEAIQSGASPSEARRLAREEAQKLADEYVEACRKIGEHGAQLLKDGMTVLTHCNAGWPATVDWGTGLAPIYVAARRGIRFKVLADETRPRCQGARLTAWELMQEGIDVAIIADNAAGYFLRKGEIDLCIVGTDRVAANGDIANKIGTYEKAVVARENSVPFYVAAPRATIDLSCPTGDDIAIEERSEDEVLYAWGFDEKGEHVRVRVSPPGAKARNPAFDVTPAKYVTGLITEEGIISADAGSIRQVCCR